MTDTANVALPVHLCIPIPRLRAMEVVLGRPFPCATCPVRLPAPSWAPAPLRHRQRRRPWRRRRPLQGPQVLLPRQTARTQQQPQRRLRLLLLLLNSSSNNIGACSVPSRPRRRQSPGEALPPVRRSKQIRISRAAERIEGGAPFWGEWWCPQSSLAVPEMGACCSLKR